MIQKLLKYAGAALLLSGTVFPQAGMAEKLPAHQPAKWEMNEKVSPAIQKKLTYEVLKNRKALINKLQQSAVKKGSSYNAQRPSVKIHPKRTDDSQVQQALPVKLNEVHNRSILIRLSDGNFDAKSFNVAEQKITPALAKRNFKLVKVPESQDYHKTLQAIRSHPSVDSAEPDYIKTSSFVPQDAEYGKQWYLDAVSLPKAWDITRGAQDVTIAVLDTGVNVSHPDLKGRLLPGYDVVNHDSDPADDNGHGTFIAGIIGAASNTTGIAGVNHNSKILPVKVASADGEYADSDIVEGIYYAIDHGADVINMSYGAYYLDQIEEEAIWEAYEKGIVLVGAAGNDGVSDPSYPASYDPVISVEATNQSGGLADFSNYGEWSDLSAPGKSIYSTNYKSSPLYKYGSGTSFSAPIVAGIAGLLKAKHPEWGPAEIEWALELGASKGKWGLKGGYGIVDAYKSLNAVLPATENDVPGQLANAAVLESGIAFSEQINKPMDYDVYSFEAEEGDKVTIDLGNVPVELDLRAMVYKWDGDSIAENRKIDEKGRGGNENYTFAAKPGTYYLAVYDKYNHWSTSSYSVKVTKNKGAQAVKNGSAVQEKEPNDTIDTAAILPLNGMGTGYFQKNGDLDAYKIQITQPGDYEIVTAVKATSVKNDAISYLSDANEDYLEEDASEYDRYDGYKFNYVTYRGLAAGTYYVVAGNGYETKDTVNPYSVFINKLERTEPPAANYNSGDYSKTLKVALKSGTEGASIYYTADGTTPSISNGILYSGPITVDKSMKIKAIAVLDGQESKVSTFSYGIYNGTLTIPNVKLPANHKHPIARLQTRQTVPMFKKNTDGSFVFYKYLDAGEFYRTFGVEGSYYNVGGQYFVRHESGKMSIYVGRALVKENTTLYTKDGKPYKALVKGEALRVYSYDGARFDAGGGYYIKNDKKVTYYVGTLTIKQDTMMYKADGMKYKTLKKGEQYRVTDIDGAKFQVGGGYYVMDEPARVSYSKN